MKTQSLKLRGETFSERLSLDRCKQVLKAKENGYSDEEVLTIRDLLYALADIDYEPFQEHKNTATVIALNHHSPHETQSHSLHPGFYRRAS